MPAFVAHLSVRLRNVLVAVEYVAVSLFVDAFCRAVVFLVVADSFVGVVVVAVAVMIAAVVVATVMVAVLAMAVLMVAAVRVVSVTRFSAAVLVSAFASWA